MIISTGNLCCWGPTALRIRIMPLKDPGWFSSCFCLQTHILSFSTSQCPKWAAFYELANQEIFTRIKNKNFKTVCSVTSVVSDSLQLFATLWSVAHQAPLSTGFSRQENWSGLSFPSPSVFLTQGLNSCQSSTLSSNSCHPPCVGRWILFHWMGWEALKLSYKKCFVWIYVLTPKCLCFRKIYLVML